MTTTLRQRAERDQTSSSFRYFVAPRILYASLNLLFGRALSGEAILVLGQQTSAAKQPSAPAGSVASSQSVVNSLGTCLVGWHSSIGSFRTFLESAPELGLSDSYYKTLALTDIFRDIPDIEAPNGFLIIETAIERLLGEMQRRMREPAAAGSAQPAPNAANPFRVAARLLRYLQASEIFWQPADSAPVSFDIPEFKKQLPSRERLLQKVASSVVELGGMSKSTKKPRWYFCTLLAPNDSSIPYHMRGLEVIGFSDLSPHDTNVKVPPTASAVTLNAYRSGSVITQLGEGIELYRSRDEPGVKSRIAVPVDGEREDPSLILYVTSDEENMFSDDDILLLRLVGRVIGELVAAQQEQQRLTADLPAVIQRPEVLDSFFTDLPAFGSENAFMRDLGTIVRQYKTANRPAGQTSAPSTALIGVDIDGVTISAGKYGGKAIRDVLRQVGKNIDDWVTAQTQTIAPYRIWADRFYLILRGTSFTEAQDKAAGLQHTLNRIYQLDSDSVPIATGADPIKVPISTRLSVVEFDADLARQRPNEDEVSLTLKRRLDETLKLARGDGGGYIYIWDNERPARLRIDGSAGPREP